MSEMKKVVFFIIFIFLTGCGKVQGNSELAAQPKYLITNSPLPEKQQVEPVFQSQPTSTPTEAVPARLWINPIISDQVTSYLSIPPGMEIINDESQADYKLDYTNADVKEEAIFTEYFVLSVPFESVVKDFSFEALASFWDSIDSGAYSIWIKEKDEFLLKNLFGPLKNPNVLVSEIIPDECVIKKKCYHIHRFEETSPGWRILSLDGVSLLDRFVDLDLYPLKTKYLIHEIKDSQNRVQKDHVWWSANANFDPDLLTVLTLTGTTALTRGTAFQMAENGVSFPIKQISDVLLKADILHVSHEVPMFEACPPAVPLREEMRFCSDPKNIEMFKIVGVDIVEITGNHLLDWGPDAFLETLSHYENQGILVYGGGISPDDAASGLEITDHGNQFVFLGCNISGPDNVWVTPERPGVLKCDQQILNKQITTYREQGLIPIVTYQHYELDGFTPSPQLQADFWQSAEAGAIIVSGSQAHFPQGFDFVNGAFIDYGVGNLFFDQMQTWYRKATIDTHYFYDGKYINTELIPIINESQGQPRLMTEEESDRFLSKLFEYSFYYEK